MRYKGSKERIAKSILVVINDCMEFLNTDTYIEPFVGGANLIDKVKAKNRYGSDIQYYLIALLSHVESGGRLPEFITREEYVAIRESIKIDGKYYNGKIDGNVYEDWYIGAAGFLASRQGNWFDGGYSGIGEGQDGKIRNYYEEYKNNIEKQRDSLKGILFECKDYRYVESTNSVIYCDIPYEGTRKYASTGGFNHQEFWEWAREMSNENIVLVSEYCAPSDWECVWSGELQSSIAVEKTYSTIEKLYIHKDWYDKMGYGEESFEF